MVSKIQLCLNFLLVIGLYQKQFILENSQRNTN